MATSVSSSLVPLLFFARISGLLAAALVIYWALVFKSSFLPQSTSQEDLVYAVLHPLLMVIGFILVSGEAILVHRWLPGSRGFKKSVHLWLQGLALACGIFGIWTKFHGNDGIVANFFSLHSWMGLICISLFGAQNVSPLLILLLTAFDWTKEASEWLMGFVSFWHRGEMRTVRIRVLPWHVFLGLYTYGLAVATAETGLLEKITLLQAKKDASKHSSESMVVNSLGLSLALLSGIIILAAVSPKFQRELKYSESKKTMTV
ncbi:transmembrane ascorbate ferrireductase 4 [Populus alba x Populus x berolinensis]|uniref:Transmembrane ascorbate ferrireductase 4 n=1 Tax=Populus alba x Populus x berolinensis TaxID=444605 RepID=A0AAD6MBN5_9ROSI|nr:transmembrane ascorbate ferrireductase 4 [Populus alba x Populus x berolinensis]